MVLLFLVGDCFDWEYLIFSLGVVGRVYDFVDVGGGFVGILEIGVL